MDFTGVLAEECVAHIISLTSPRDASRCSLVCHSLRSFADSDAVWSKFLPPDPFEVISGSTSSSTLLSSLSKKQLYFYLCDNPIIIKNGTMSFSLEKLSGKKCYMIGARGLSITWGDTPCYWTWQPSQESRFLEVTLLNYVWTLDIKGRPVVLGVERRDTAEVTRSVFLDPRGNVGRATRERGDGWMEVEMGEFLVESRDDGEVVCSLLETHDFTIKEGLIVEGIEFRPKVVI